MKKRQFIILILLLSTISTAYYYFSNKELSADQITLINVYKFDNELVTSFNSVEDISEIDVIASLINSSLKTKEIVNAELDQRLEITINNRILYYDLFVDFDNQELYILKNGKGDFLKTSNASMQEFLLINGLESIYPTYEPPLVSLNQNNVTNILTPISFIWNYLKIDGNYYIHTMDQLSSPATSALSLNPDDILELDFSIVPDSITIEVMKDGKTLKELAMINNTFKPLEGNGTFTYTITLGFEKTYEKDYYGTIVYSFLGKMDLPPKVTIQNSKVSPGGLFVIKLENLDDNQVPIIQQDITDNIEVHNFDDYKIAIIPLDYWVKTGDYPLEIYLESNSENQLIYQGSLEIINRDFRKQYLVIDSKIEEATRNDAAYEEFAKYFTPVRKNSEPSKLWEGDFIIPVEGRLTTEYGMMRFVNGSLASSPHSGLDLAAPKGTPILASNGGKVVLSMNLILTGETIVIDHGLGFFTVYYHMDQRYSIEGDMVTKGETIGTVGSTGFSTGPHLHWTTSYYTTNIDPYMLIDWEGLE
ncbi:M23 family metallopeptidase [Alkaliphilus peptidifermentans]|uniref:Peptidase family M23 n=1 Tax=Alkaliphilus peptidifermentans DSM 18978 TaxID=1120976 RepID=A0A1G5F1U4_9FIRM|nr:M23 family metallopeptidase [Alkaliphilus peptidifermentans]SCY33081.1 Peptidase family M23 [Alkaliphilus peptidifermentans DSM 18978]